MPPESRRVLECIVTVFDGKKEVGKGRGTPGSPITVAVRSPKLWSPDDTIPL